MKQYQCVICRETMSSINAMRCGGIIELMLGKCYICRSCAARGVSNEDVLRAVKHDKANTD